MPTRHSKSQKIYAVDLFCGIGGLTYGFAKSRISVKAGFDIDSSCQYAYETNNPYSEFISADVRKINFHRDISKYYRGADITVLAGCAPCQPFSAHTRRMKNAPPDDCSLLKEFGRLVKEGTPDLISMENVPGLSKHAVFDEFCKTLKDLGYEYKYDILSALDYGVPQRRKRLVLLASKIGEISLPKPVKKKRTVADLIRGIPAIKDGETLESDPAHTALLLSEKNRQRIRQSKPGGSWRDWDKNLVSDCHRKAYYPAPYGRMRWDAPAPTITTQFCYYSTGRFGHPKQHRAISVREGALLQTFPKDYKLVEKEHPLIMRKMARHIGNAVPVSLAKAIGTSITEAANV